VHVLQCLLRLSLGGRLSVGMTVRHRGCERCGAGQQPSNDGRAGFLSQGNRLNRRRFRQPGKHVLSAIQEDFQHGGRREDDGGHGVRVQSASREAQFAFCSVVLRGSPCFLRVKKPCGLPTSMVAAMQDHATQVRFLSHVDAIQAIVLVPSPCESAPVPPPPNPLPRGEGEDF